MMWWNDGMGWGSWITMALLMVAFWALVIYAVVAMFRGGPDNGASGLAEDHDPFGILDERFARGEIDADEYHARRDALRAAR